MTPSDFTAVVARLLRVPRLEGTFRVRDGERDVTDDFSELRFSDARFGGYLDRSRVEECLLSVPLVLWLRGAPEDDPLDGSQPPRNRWTIVVPPHTPLTVTSPRRSFAVLKAAHGGIERGRPFSSGGRLVVGRTIEATAAATGLVAQLDWLFESPEVNLARATGTDVSAATAAWHRTPLRDLIADLAWRTAR